MGNARPKILIVEDNEDTRQVFQLLLESKRYAVATAKDGEAALLLVGSEAPDLILLDISMPGLSGFEVVKRLKSEPRTRAIPVVMVTGLGDRESRMKALESGAEDFLAKPVDPSELWVRVRNLLRLKEYGDFLANHNQVLEAQVQKRTAQLRASYREMIFLMTSAAEHRDEETGAHVKRISYYSARLAQAVGQPAEFVDSIFYASPMHDIGKIGIPDHILLKPGPLSPREWEIMKTHTIIGKKILARGSAPYVKMGAEIALTHHENWDGSGYPAGLKAEQIPIAGCIMRLCDQYDALRSRRPYKPALDHETTERIIVQGDERTKPAHFHPAVLKSFRERSDDFRKIFAEHSE